MELIRNMDVNSILKLKYVLFDIDDTITLHGKLPMESYDAMWKLNKAGFEIIPITGRPAGWCDLIIRQWPVKAVVGENGAFVYYWDNDKISIFVHPNAASGNIHKKLELIKEECINKVPGCREARDQSFRKYDLAIDFREDTPYLDLDAAEKIKDICLSMGAEAKISSIHVNAWYGHYDKLETTKLFMEKTLKEDRIREKTIFFGDSPNDEPMFHWFPNSCGVANILPFIDKIKYLPKFITNNEGGIGFAEAANYILACKKAV